MKSFTFATLLSLGLSASALNHPSLPKTDAIITTPEASVWATGAEVNQTVSTAIELFIKGPDVDPKNVTAEDLRILAVTILGLAPSAVDAPATEVSEPKVTVWAEGPQNQTETTVDVFIARQSGSKAVTTGDLRDIAYEVLELSKKVDAGEATRPGAYVPGWNGGVVGLKK